jgi:ribose transport system permease protein
LHVPAGDVTASPRFPPRHTSQVSALIFVRDHGVIVLWLIMMGAFSIWAAPTFGTFSNLMLIFESAAITGTFAAGAAFGIQTGLLDLSLPGTAAVTGIVVAKLLLSGTPTALALLAGLAVGVAVGAINASLTLCGLNSLIVTIGMFSALAGLASVISGGVPVTVTRLAFIGAATYARVPGPVFVMAGVFLLGTLFMTQTRAGTRMLAVGGDAGAARRAGVRTAPYIVLGFILVSVCAAIGGVVIAAFTVSATPVPDPIILFQAITAVALSGMPFSGGRGSFPRVIVGALIIATISSALVIKNIHPYWATVATGVLLIMALSVERIVNRAVTTRLVVQ